MTRGRVETTVQERDVKRENLVANPSASLRVRRRVVTTSIVVIVVLLVARVSFGPLGNCLRYPNVGRVFEQGERNRVDEPPLIYPSYSNATIPVNIAPLNFVVQNEGSDYVTRLRGADGSETLAFGKTASFNLGRWRDLLQKSRGKQIEVDVFIRETSEGKKIWRAYAPFTINVSDDPVDPYLHYRLIEPGYELFNRPTLAQRHLETFDERVWFDSKAVDARTCVNCHTFQNRSARTFLFHARRVGAGTIFCRDGRVEKLSPKGVNSELGASYAAWNPVYPLVAFSTNSTFQLFHTLDKDRIDVLDATSDLILYDPQTDKSESICDTRDELETFPSWSPDGKYLYYCVSRSPYVEEQVAESSDDASKFADVYDSKNVPEIEKNKVAAPRLYDRFHYNIARRYFDPATRRFDDPEIVVDAAEMGKSALHPRVSPDGDVLVFSLCKNGGFPIWRRDADLWSVDLKSGTLRQLDELNSEESESWSEWDSSGRWLFFSSRRDDGTFTRVYIAHYSRDGRWGVPFLLPQRDPESNRNFMKSYNLPEPTREPISVSSRRLVEASRAPNRRSR